MRLTSFFLVLFMLVGCASDQGRVTEEADENVTTGVVQTEVVYTTMTDGDGPSVAVFGLQDRSIIESPLVLEGFVRRDWVFEGSFPITIMTLENTVVKEGYGTAAWLEPLEGDTLNDMTGEDMIPFTANIEFKSPEGGDMGKIRFGNSVIGDDDVETHVDLMILWP